MTVVIKCACCQKETTNPRFCSKSCCAKITNKEKPIRSKRRCKICGEYSKRVSSEGKSKCDKCKHFRTKLVRLPNGTIRPVVINELRTYIDNLTKDEASSNDTQRHRRIRSNARHKANQLGILKSCYICGYTHYVECCHKKPIKSFPGTSRVSEINSDQNLIGLCPNHHWEFDHGLLEHIKTSPCL